MANFLFGLAVLLIALSQTLAADQAAVAVYSSLSKFLNEAASWLNLLLFGLLHSRIRELPPTY